MAQRSETFRHSALLPEIALALAVVAVILMIAPAVELAQSIAAPPLFGP